MTWALVGIVGVLAGVVAVLAGAGWWFGKQALVATRQVTAEAEKSLELRQKLLDLGQQQERTHETLVNVQKERDRQLAAREVVARQLEEAMELAAKVRDPAAAALRIRGAINRLRNLAEEVPDVPTPATPDHG